MVQGWRAGFKAQFGREPRVWLDKACIEQGDIDANLMCLPVFLSSCSTLLVLLSPTYLERLWCVSELFVFLHMGGTADRIEVLLPGRPTTPPPVHASQQLSRGPGPLTPGHLSSQGTGSVPSPVLDVHRAIKAFDARRASCSRLEDRERLLTVIEMGFGGLSAFNEVIIKLLGTAMQGSEASGRLSGSPWKRGMQRSGDDGELRFLGRALIGQGNSGRPPSERRRNSLGPPTPPPEL